MINISNEAFLRSIFGEQYQRAWVTGFPESPYETSGSSWHGSEYGYFNGDLSQNANTFFAISVFQRRDGVGHRRKTLFDKTYVIMIDDVGTKIPKELADLVLPEPTYTIETSPGNYQYGYALAEPESNLYNVENFQHGLIAMGLSKDNKDPGMFGVTRYCRLPVGVNNKVPGRTWQHRVHVWRPELKYHLEDLAKDLAIDISARPTRVAQHAAEDITTDHLYKCFLRAGAVKEPILGKPGGYHVTCPWVSEHTGKHDTGSAYFVPGYSDGDQIYTKGLYKCYHGHCEDRNINDLRVHFAEQYPDMLRDLFNLGIFKPIEEDHEELSALSISAWLDSDPPEREWVFQDVLPLGKVGLLVAAGGTGKSFLTLQMAASVATGTPLCNIWMPPAAGGVLCVYAEEDRDELHRRFNAIRKTFSDMDAGALSANLYIATAINPGGEDPNRLMTEHGRSVTRTDNVRVLMEQALRVKRQTGNLRLLILDPLIRFTAGNESDPQHATKFVETIEHIAAVLKCTVLVTHHQNKMSSKDLHQTQDASRGSTGFPDGARWQTNLRGMHPSEALSFNLPEDECGKFIQLAMTKQNYGVKHPPVWLHRGDSGVLNQCTLQKAMGAQMQVANLIPRLVQLIENEFDKGRLYTAHKLSSEFSGLGGPMGCSQNKCMELIRYGLDCGVLAQREYNRGYVLISTAHAEQYAEEEKSDMRELMQNVPSKQESLIRIPEKVPRELLPPVPNKKTPEEKYKAYIARRTKPT